MCVRVHKIDTQGVRGGPWVRSCALVVRYVVINEYALTLTGAVGVMEGDNDDAKVAAELDVFT